jgi:SAM-dependent methyltransferase
MLVKLAQMFRRHGPLGALQRIYRAVAPKPPNTIQANLRAWSEWDWSNAGEEWSDTPEWKASVVQHLLEPHVPEGSRILEIGPGGGRWTEFLVRRASHLTVVDLTPRCIELCRARFAGRSNITFHVNDGSDLGFVPDASIDRIWSFDVFVHIQAIDIEAYVAQFPRILRPGGTALIHHSKSGTFARGWRSDMTEARMREICARNGLTILAQRDSWDEGRVRIYGEPGQPSPDVISIVSKPA